MIAGVFFLLFFVVGVSFFFCWGSGGWFLSFVFGGCLAFGGDWGWVSDCSV